jgi:formiminotetrahydrofolate cyclodeaminase
MAADQSGLVSRSVRDFIEHVASVEQAVPAGGSVSALTGTASAALLARVCGVLARKGVEGLDGLLARAEYLQAHLLALVDEDAEAFRDFLRAKRAGEDVSESVDRTSQAPLAIARACLDVADLSREVEPRTVGPMLGDVRAARHLARAAAAAALDLAEQDVGLNRAPSARAELQREISAIRGRMDAPRATGSA